MTDTDEVWHDPTEYLDLGFWQNADELAEPLAGRACPCGACVVACLLAGGFRKTLCASGCINAWLVWTGCAPPLVRPIYMGTTLEL